MRQLQLAAQPRAFGLLDLQPCVLDRDCSLVRDAHQDAHAARAEHVAMIHIVGQQRADRFIGHQQRHHQDRPAAEPFAPGLGHARIALHVIDDQRLPGPARVIQQGQLARLDDRTPVRFRQAGPQRMDGARPEVAFAVREQRHAPVYAGQGGRDARHLFQRHIDGLQPADRLGYLQQHGRRPHLFLAHGRQPAVVHRGRDLVRDPL